MKSRFEDIKRTVMISDALQTLDAKSYLFREAYSLGYPKFSDVAMVRPGQRMTAFVGVDGKGNFLFCWGRAFFDELCEDEHWPEDTDALGRVAFVLAHETLHVVLHHIERCTGKVASLWNWAADVVVNWYCEWYGLQVLPNSCTVNSRVNVKDLGLVTLAQLGINPEVQTTEQIYEILLKHAEVMPEFGPGMGYHDQWDQLDEKTKEILKPKIDEAIAKAAERDAKEGKNSGGDPDAEDGDDSGGGGKGCGNLPGDGALGEIRQLSDQITAEHVVPWDKIVRRRIGSLWEPCVVEKWGRLPTRMASQWGRVCLPRQTNDRARSGIHILMALDASASMDKDDVERMRSIAASLPNEFKVTLASFDTECYILESLNEIKGGGGTDLDDLNRVAEELEVDCVVCLTDGGFNTPNLGRPDIWVFVIDGDDRHVPRGATCLNV